MPETPTRASYAREIRRESRDALLLVSLLQTWPPMNRDHIEQVVAHAWRAADRARNGGMDLPKTLAVKAIADRVSEDATPQAWRALIDAAREARDELDATVDYTRPA